MSNDKVTIDDLARMVARGFNEVNEKVDKGFREVGKRMDQLEMEIHDVKLRQDNTAYRFELKDLEERVTRLETNAKSA